MLDERTERLGAGVRIDLDDTAAFETHGQPVDDPALGGERLRRADESFGAVRIRRGEDLLGREVRHVGNPVDRGVAPAHPARGRQ